MSSAGRSALFDLAAGLSAVAGTALALVVQRWSEIGFEYLLLSLPGLLFPAATWLRSKSSVLSPLTTFVLVNGWLILVYWLFSMAASDLRSLALPLVITVAGSLLCLVASRRSRERAAGTRRWLAALLIAVPALITAGLVPATLGKMLTHAVEEQAPDAVLPLIDGGEVSIAAQRGRVVVLSFWGVWCVPCVQELPEIEAVSRTYRGGQRAAFVAVNSAVGGETLAEVKAFVAKHGLTLPIAYDPDRTLYKAFRVHAMPTTIVVDPQGVIRYRRVGYAATADFGSWLAGTVDRLGSGKHS
jgi:cytochrome c biogenesis protein CcmG/thiol:disulfide interchange protein DsbE